MSLKRIVLIHAVGEGGMRAKNIVRYIKWMKLCGFRFVSLDQIAADKPRGKFLSLVVDDAYKCVVTALLPILKQYNIPCTLFVPPGLLGLKANDLQLLSHACYPNEDMMDIEDLHVWSENGFEVAFHTNKHIDLSVTGFDTQQEDFVKGMDSLKELGYKPDKFAYPFGRLPEEVEKFQSLLSANGIKYAYTLWPGNADIHTPYFISRICLGDHTPVWWNVLKSVGWLDKRLRKRCESSQMPCKIHE